MMGDRRKHLALRGSQWRSALLALLMVVAVLGAALVGRTLVGHARRGVVVAPVPLGPLRVAAVTAPGTSYEHLALDADAGHLVALAGAVPRGCPPIGACALSSPASAFVVLNGVTGAQITSAPFAGAAASAAHATLLLADSTTHTAYAVAPEEVTRFSTESGQFEGGFLTPGTLGGTISGGTLGAAPGTLVLAGGSSLGVVDATSGAVRASLAIPSLASGPALDPATQRLFVLAGEPSSRAGMTLMALDAATLAPRGQLALPGGMLGPIDSSGRALLYFGADGTTYRIALDGPLGASALAAAPEMRGAVAAGWIATLGHTFRATADSLDVLDTHNGTTLGALPVRALQSAGHPLLVDVARGLLYVPAASGAVLIVRDEPTGAALDAATSLLLARAALARFLPNTNQDPPFVASETFPVAADPTATGVAHDYWIHFSDLGWQGPYPGSAGTSVVPDPHHPGGFVVTFRIAWYQLFARSHTWACTVAADGSVTLQSDAGDAVP